MDVAIEQKLKRLMLRRVVMVTTLLRIAVYVEAVSETLQRVNPLYFLNYANDALLLTGDRRTLEHARTGIENALRRAASGAMRDRGRPPAEAGSRAPRRRSHRG